MKILSCFLLFSLFISCQNERVEDIDKIENTFQESPEFQKIKEYILEKETFGNQYYWGEEYKILRHLVLGDSLNLTGIGNKLMFRTIKKHNQNLIPDSLNLKPLKDYCKNFPERKVLRITVKTSIIPFVTVLTIIEDRDSIQLEYKDCLFSYYYEGLTDKVGGPKYSIMVNGELKKGRFIMLNDERKEISRKELSEIYKEIPPFWEIKNDFEGGVPDVIDGETINIERYYKYSEESIDSMKMSTRCCEIRNELISVIDNIMEE